MRSRRSSLSPQQTRRESRTFVICRLCNNVSTLSRVSLVIERDRLAGLSDFDLTAGIMRLVALVGPWWSFGPPGNEFPGWGWQTTTVPEPDAEIIRQSPSTPGRVRKGEACGARSPGNSRNDE